MTILNMQHTLTPFLIRALSKTEGEKKKGERRARDREKKRRGAGERLKTRERERNMGGKEESRGCCIDFLAVWHQP